MKQVKKLNIEFKAVKLNYRSLYHQHMVSKESYKNFVRNNHNNKEHLLILRLMVRMYK
jgi:hypothetical protein